MLGCRLTLSVLLISSALGKEVVLFDLDFSGRLQDAGSPIEFGEGPYPGRKTFTRINFGSATIGQAPTSLSDSAAILQSSWDGSSYLAYSQPELQLINGGVYAFYKHRIETSFQFISPAATEGGDGLRILTDGSVTYSLDFKANGSVMLEYNTLVDHPLWGMRVETASVQAGTFDVDQPVHLVWDLDSTDRTSSVSINGVTFIQSDLAVKGPGLRNGVLYPGPGWIRFSYNDTGAVSGLALKDMKVTGSRWAGPLWQNGGERWGSEVGLVELPVASPPAGQWQPEFSEDGVVWIPFGAEISAANGLTGLLCGREVCSSLLIRLREVE